MQPAAPLPSFLSGATAAPAPAARPRLLDMAPAPAYAADVYRPAAMPRPAYQPQPAYQAAPAAYPPPGYAPPPAYASPPGYPPPYGQAPQPVLKPVYSPQGELLGYVAAPPAPAAPANAPVPLSANQRTGQAALTTVTAGLGVAGVFAPPVLPFAGAIGLVQALDNQIGSPVAKTVGTVVNGVVDGAEAVGRFFGGLFGGKKQDGR